MIKVFLTSCILSILFFSSGCDNISETDRFLFNGHWQFIRLNQGDTNKVEIENQGADWSSQFDVAHISSDFSINIDHEVLKSEFKQIESAKWEEVSLPHTPRIEDLTVLRQWQGVCYYKKQFIAKNTWKDQICYIEFEGAMQLADIWFNGKHINQHAGGYTPFVIDITDYLKWGDQNEILVRLDNRNNPLIPPGKPLEDLDFNYYGGIYRDVNFIVKNKIHVTHPILANEIAGGGVFVTYEEVTAAKAIISVQTHVHNDTEEQANILVRQSLIRIDGLFQQRKTGAEIAISEKIAVLSPDEAKHIKQIIEVENPQLWSPDAPFLYILRTELLNNGKLLDS